MKSGWNENIVLKNRLEMYKRFNKANPHVDGIGSILVIISVLQVIYYLVQLIKYFNQIDSILIKEYTMLKSNVVTNTTFDNDLENYLLCLKKQT